MSFFSHVGKPFNYSHEDHYEDLEPSYSNLLAIRQRVKFGFGENDDHLMQISAFKERKEAYDWGTLIGTEEVDCYEV